MDEEMEMDLANKILDQLKDEGYRSIQEKLRPEQFKRALRDYDRYLSNPYPY